MLVHSNVSNFSVHKYDEVVEPKRCNMNKKSEKGEKSKNSRNRQGVICTRLGRVFFHPGKPRNAYVV